MTEHTTKRIEIVAAIITILSALYFLLRPKKTAPPAVIVTPGGNVVSPFAAGPVAAAPAPGQVGPAGAPGQPGQPGAPGAPGAPATAGAQSQPVTVIVSGYHDPGYFTSLDQPAAGPFQVPLSHQSNLPPALDLPKMFMAIASPPAPQPAGAACGCGSQAGGSQGSPCKNGCNSSAGIVFPDGPGTCMSSSPKTLASAESGCVKDLLQTSLENMASNRQYFAVWNADQVKPFIQSLRETAQQIPFEGFEPNAIFYTRFGAN